MKKISKALACIIAAMTVISATAMPASALEPENITMTKDVNLTYDPDCSDISIGKNNLYNLSFEKKYDETYSINAEGVISDGSKPDAEKALTVSVNDDTVIKEKYIFNIKLSKDETKTIEGLVSFDEDGVPSTILFKEDFSFSYSGKKYDGILYGTYDLNTGELLKTEAEEVVGGNACSVYETGITYTTIFSQDKRMRFVVTNEKAPYFVTRVTALSAVVLYDKDCYNSFKNLITEIATNETQNDSAEPCFVTDELIVLGSEYEIDSSLVTYFNSAFTFTKGTISTNKNLISYAENKDGKVEVTRFKF